MRRVSYLLIGICAVLLGQFQAGATAATITNANLTGPPTVVIPSNWSQFTGSGFLNPSGLFDGISANTGNGRLAYSHTGANLSSSNYISISVDLAVPYQINSLSIANDYGGAADQEITAMEVLLNGDSGTLATLSASGLNNGVLTDLDEVFSGQAIQWVTNIEFRITGNEGGNIEVREFVLTGHEIPEPSTVVLALSGLLALALYRWRRSR